MANAHDAVSNCHFHCGPQPLLRRLCFLTWPSGRHFFYARFRSQAADIDGMRDLILCNDVHGKTLDETNKIIVDVSESIGTIQKRCFK